MKPGIKDYSYDELLEIFKAMGEKEYRVRQLFNWLYEKNIDDFSLMTNFSKELRQKLADQFALSPLTLEDREKSSIDATEKFLFRTEDNHFIESVLIKNEMSDEGDLLSAYHLRSDARWMQIL
jgi:23S rRNA (adenine2503-C2)-methyltransferase